MRVDQGPLERGGEDEQRARETARRLLGRGDPAPVPAPARAPKERPAGTRPRFLRFQRGRGPDEPEGTDEPEGIDEPEATGGTDDREATGETDGSGRRGRAPRAHRGDRPVPIWRRTERWRRAQATDGAHATGRPRGGRRRGVVRKVDTWSVFKVSLVFYTAMYCIVLVAGVVLWLAATASGLRHNVESFIADLIASGKFHFVATELLRAAAVSGMVLVVLGTAANVLLAVLYNLISDMVGGIDVVIDERPLTRPASRRKPGRPEAALEPVDEADDEVEVFEPRPSEASQ